MKRHTDSAFHLRGLSNTRFSLSHVNVNFGLYKITAVPYSTKQVKLAIIFRRAGANNGTDSARRLRDLSNTHA